MQWYQFIVWTGLSVPDESEFEGSGAAFGSTPITARNWALVTSVSPKLKIEIVLISAGSLEYWKLPDGMVHNLGLAEKKIEVYRIRN